VEVCLFGWGIICSFFGLGQVQPQRVDLQGTALELGHLMTAVVP
jgi:hypothetical protein